MPVYISRWLIYLQTVHLSICDPSLSLIVFTDRLEPRAGTAYRGASSGWPMEEALCESIMHRE